MQHLVAKFIGGAMGALISVSLWAAENPVVRLAQSPFAESFLGNPKVSGNVLVGLQLGRSEQAFNPTGIGVPVSARFSARRSCVLISSRDGRYSAENAYELPAGTGISTLEMPTRYASQLSKMKFEDIAVLVRDVPVCASVSLGALVPVLMPKQGSGELIALINPGFARAEARVVRDGKEIVATTRCTDISGEIRIAYSSRCVLSANPPLHGDYVLELTLRETTSRDTISFPILIP